MEYALRVCLNHQYIKYMKRLDPYSNGICSMRKLTVLLTRTLVSLNPCSNGICSASYRAVDTRLIVAKS